MQSLMLDLVGGSGEKPQSEIPCEQTGRENYRDARYSEGELAELMAAPVGELAVLHIDMLEADDDYDCRSQRTRQIRGVIKKRGISRQELDRAYVQFQREQAFRVVR